MTRYVTDKAHDPRSRFGLYRLCDCTRCGGKGKAMGYRCPVCRGKGRTQQEVASAKSPEAVGVALVTLAREGEWDECPFGLLDREPTCETCGGDGRVANLQSGTEPCSACKGSGVKPTGTWLVLPWTASPRNVSDAGKLLRSRRSS